MLRSFIPAGLIIFEVSSFGALAQGPQHTLFVIGTCVTSTIALVSKRVYVIGMLRTLAPRPQHMGIVLRARMSSTIAYLILSRIIAIHHCAFVGAVVVLLARLAMSTRALATGRTACHMIV